jgi:hypothetical protein
MKITTLEEAFEAVRINLWNLMFVPEALKTPELCKIVVENYGRALDYVPEALKTPELCKIAVEQHGWALEYVPEALKTPELCRIAVEQYGQALQFVPEALKTPELYKLSVKNSSFALQYVPNQKSFLTTYPEFLPKYFEITDKKKQDPNLISLLIQTANNKVIDEIGNKINLYKIRKKDLPFLVGCQNKAITDFLNKKFKTKGT